MLSTRYQRGWGLNFELDTLEGLNCNFGFYWLFCVFHISRAPFSFRILTNLLLTYLKFNKLVTLSVWKYVNSSIIHQALRRLQAVPSLCSPKKIQMHLNKKEMNQKVRKQEAGGGKSVGDWWGLSCVELGIHSCKYCHNVDTNQQRFYQACTMFTRFFSWANSWCWEKINKKYINKNGKTHLPAGNFWHTDRNRT